MRKFVASLSCVALAGLSTVAHAAAPLQSGLYEGLTVAVAADGHVTGHYREDQGQGVTKSCTFSFQGRATPAGKAAITAWSDAGGQRLPGTLTANADGGVTLTLPHARDFPGCGLVLLPIVDQGLDLDRVASGSWARLVKVTAPKVALQPAPGAATGHAYVVRGDVLGVTAAKNGLLQVIYPSSRPHPSQGWLNEKDVSPIG